MKKRMKGGHSPETMRLSKKKKTADADPIGLDIVELTEKRNV